MTARRPRSRRWRGSAWSEGVFGLVAVVVLFGLGVGLIIAAGICVPGTVR